MSQENMGSIKSENKEERKIIDIGTKSIPKLLLSYSLTTFLALMLSSIYTITDAIFIGRGIGIEALGGIAATFPFAVIQGGVATTIGGGAAILVSQLLGKNQRKKAGEVVLSAAIMFWSVALAISVLGLIFIDPLMNALGIAENLKIYAKQYLTIILISNIFSTGFSAVMRAEGKMLFALLQWIIPISTNIILDYIFIFVFNMGVKGAAYATMFSLIVSFITAMIFFTRFTSLQFKGSSLKRKTLQDILTAGFPSIVQYGSIAIGLSLLNNVLKIIGGEQMQITYGIVNKIFMFFIVPFTAITQALQPVAGYSFGAGKLNRVKSAMNYTVLFSLIASVVALIICQLIPRALVRIFTSDQEIIYTAATALRYIAISFPFMFLPSAVAALFQSIGKKISAALLFAISFVFVPPFAMLFGKIIDKSIIWLAFPAGSIVASGVAAIWLMIFFKNFNSKANITEIDGEK